MLRRVDRSFSFDVPDATTADIREGVERRGTDIMFWRFRVEGDRLSVTMQTSGQFATRLMWRGTMTDRSGGVRLEGRVHDGPSRIVSGCFAAITLFAVAILGLVVIEGGGAEAAVGMAAVSAVLLVLWRWYAGHVRRDVDDHKADTVRMVDHLLERAR